MVQLPKRRTLIRSSPAAGAGRGTSSTTTTSGAPKRWIRAAFIFAPLIVQETDPSRSLGPQRVRRAAMDGRVAQESDEFALSHANVLVEYQAYHRAALCITAKICRRWQRWVIRVISSECKRLPLFPQEPTFGCSTISVAEGQKATSLVARSPLNWGHGT